VSFVRTVLGDIDPADLGPAYAHEHLVIDGGRMVELSSDFLLADVDKAVAELAPARALGLGAVVDAMPCDLGRNVDKLAQISERSGIHVVAPTGLHLARYYGDHHWSRTLSVEQLSTLFVADISSGIDANDYSRPPVWRTAHRAGVIKVAGSERGLTDQERRVYEAAAMAHVQTGAPILAHCTDGKAAPEQVRFLADHGVDLAHVVLSHTDKVVDRAYHREIMSSGVCQEFDQGFRWKDGIDNGTLTLLDWLVEDGFGDRLMLGMDAARQGYWTAYGGTPGMTYLLGAFSNAMTARGLGADVQGTLFVANPARAYAFAEARPTPTPAPTADARS
jgi:predicted metal-dependent phosphotriesterase family hydrolase